MTADRSSKASRHKMVRRRPKAEKSKSAAQQLAERRGAQKALAKEIGERLTLARHSRQLSQMDLAVACEVTRAAVSQWERGGTLVDKINLRKMAARLNVPLEWVEFGENPPQLVQPVGPTRMLRRRQHEITRPPFNGAVPEMEQGLGLSSSFGTEDSMFDWWRLPPRFADALGVDLNNVRAYRIVRENLKDFNKQDVVFVDVSQRDLLDGCLYVIDMEVGLVLKKVEIDPANPTQITLSDRTGSRVMSFKGIQKEQSKVLGRCVMQAHIL